jgi:hypothetical protein
MKATLYRLAVSASTLTALAYTLGAGRKWS